MTPDPWGPWPSWQPAPQGFAPVAPAQPAARRNPWPWVVGSGAGLLVGALVAALVTVQLRPAATSTVLAAQPAPFEASPTPARTTSAPPAADAELRASAVTFARREATAFSTFDYRSFETQIQDLATTATPAFQTKLQELHDTLSSTLAQTQGTSKGTVVDVAVEDLSSSSASVLVFLDQVSTAAAKPEPRTDDYRLKIRLTRDTSSTGGWLVDDILVV